MKLSLIVLLVFLGTSVRAANCHRFGLRVAKGLKLTDKEIKRGIPDIPKEFGSVTKQEVDYARENEELAILVFDGEISRLDYWKRVRVQTKIKTTGRFRSLEDPYTRGPSQDERDFTFAPGVLSKILWGKLKPNHKIIGAHCWDITQTSDYIILKERLNVNGTVDVVFQKRDADGSLSPPKFSTLAPKKWGYDEIELITFQVIDIVNAIQLEADGSVVFRGRGTEKYSRNVDWQTTIDGQNQIWSSFPVGGILDF